MFCIMASSLVFVASGTTASDMMKMVGEKEGMLEDGCSLRTWTTAPPLPQQRDSAPSSQYRGPIRPIQHGCSTLTIFMQCSVLVVCTSLTQFLDCRTARDVK